MELFNSKAKGYTSWKAEAVLTNALQSCSGSGRNLGTSLGSPPVPQGVGKHKSEENPCVQQTAISKSSYPGEIKK